MNTLSRRRFAVLTAVSVLSAAALAAPIPAAAEPVVGSPAPTFSGTDTKGQKVNLADYLGKTVILEWTNHDCPYVKKHYESDNMQAMQRSYTDDDVVWLSIISSAPGKQGYVSPDEAIQLTNGRQASPSHVLFDPEGTVGKQYSAETTPHMYIIDPEQVLRYAGAIDSIRSTKQSDIAKAINYVKEGMAALGEGQLVDPKLTKAYGCSIKYKS